MKLRVRHASHTYPNLSTWSSQALVLNLALWDLILRWVSHLDAMFILPHSYPASSYETTVSPLWVLLPGCRPSHLLRLRRIRLTTPEPSLRAMGEQLKSLRPTSAPDATMTSSAKPPFVPMNFGRSRHPRVGLFICPPGTTRFSCRVVLAVKLLVLHFRASTNQEP